VVVFDEFQEIAAWDAGERVQRKMRAHFRHHREVVHVFMGSKRHLMREIFQQKNRPFYRFGKHFPLGKIPGEFAAFIRRRFEDTGFRVERSVPERILAVTRTILHPAPLPRALGPPAGRARGAGGGRGCGDRGGHRPGGTCFPRAVGCLPLKARQFLVALVREGTPRAEIYSSSFLRRHKLGSASSVQRTVERLLANEILERVNGAYEFTDIFFKRWINRGFR
jgi:hypothetical protein